MQEFTFARAKESSSVGIGSLAVDFNLATHLINHERSLLSVAVTSQEVILPIRYGHTMTGFAGESITIATATLTENIRFAPAET